MNKVVVKILNEKVGFEITHDPRTMTYNIQIPDREIKEALMKFDNGTGKVTDVLLEISGTQLKAEREE